MPRKIFTKCRSSLRVLGVPPPPPELVPLSAPTSPESISEQSETLSVDLSNSSVADLSELTKTDLLKSYVADSPESSSAESPKSQSETLSVDLSNSSVADLSEPTKTDLLKLCVTDSSESISAESPKPDVTGLSESPIAGAFDSIFANFPEAGAADSFQSFIADSPEESTSFITDSSSSSSTYGTVSRPDSPLDMANAQLKFITPPVFHGRPEEDALDWLSRYESIGGYNRWGNNELRANFIMYLDGTARKWFKCLTAAPAEWIDVNVAGPPPTVNLGLRTLFLNEFQPANYGFFQEKKLRNRTQGLEEPTSSYFYDVLDLCRLVDPTMTEDTKLEYLFRGLRPTLVEKIYPLQPVTCAEFLGHVKVFEQAADMANRREWVTAQLNPALPGKSTSHAVNYCTPATNAIAAVTMGQPDPTNEILRTLKMLQETQQKMQQELTQLNTKVNARRSNPPGTDGNRPYSRTSDGRPICNYCNKIGHMERFCRTNPHSVTYIPPPPISMRQPTAVMGSLPSPPATDNTADTARVATIVLGEQVAAGLPVPVLFVRARAAEGLVFKKVSCNNRIIEAVIDTGAAVTVISPQLAESMGCTITNWDGPKIVMANGAEEAELGQTHLTIVDGTQKAVGKALVMKMKGVELLMGNSFLRQFKNVHIQYDTEESTVNLGDNPLLAILPEPETVRYTDQLVLRDSCRLPAWTMAMVRAKGPLGATDKTWLVEPSQNLFLKKGVTIGHVILSSTVNPLIVPLVNFTSNEEWLEAGTSLGQIKQTGLTIGADSEVNQLNLGLLTSAKSTEEKTEEKDDPDSQAATQEPRDARRNKKWEQLWSSINPQLSKEEKNATFELLTKFEDCFAEDEEDLGHCSMAEHAIEVGDANPIHQRAYKSAWRERAIIQKQVDQMLRQGVIEPSESPWSSPVVLVKKKNGEWRFCVDYRKLNAVTVNDVYPLPRIEDSLSKLEGSKFFSIMDLQAGYHQIPVRPEDRPKTAFITADGLWQFRMMPFGLRTAGQTFQRAVDTIFGRLKWWACLAYLDDTIVHAPSVSEHLIRLELSLTCVRQAKFKLKPSKCHFLQTELKILGHIVTRFGLTPDPEKVKAISDFPSPNDAKTTAAKIKAVQSFVGLCSYYRRHVASFAMIAQPLTELTKSTGTFQWDSEQQESFTKLKQALAEAATLTHPNYDQPMELHADACGYGVGCALVQRIDGLERPIAFASRLLSKSESNYSITEKECLALVWATKKFRNFLWGNKVHVFTDHQALCWLMTKRDLAGRLARWSLTLQEFDLSIFYKNGKAHADADCLSRYPVELPQTEEEEDRCLIVAITSLSTESEPDELAVAQADVPYWKTAIETLRKGKKAGSYCLVGQRLHRLTKVKRDWHQRLCLPVNYRTEVLRRYHDETTAGHLGMTRCIHQLKKRFYWPKMDRFIQAYIRACQSCQARKGVADKPAGLLQCIRAERPFQRVGMDLLGPFPLSNKGNRQIIVAIDYLTKWVEVRAMPTGTANDTANFLVEQVYLRHGAPEQLITDRGKCFVSELMQSVNKLLTTNHRTTSAYNPACNGQVERFNHVIADMLSMYVSADHKDWDETLPFVIFAYNTTRQESTGFSPFYLLYGREPIVPSDLSFNVDPNPLIPAKEASMEYIQRLRKNLESARHTVLTRMERVKQKQKITYDGKHRETTYKKGDLVLVFKPIRKVGRSEKLLHRWLGPFIVVRQTTPVNYEVILKDGRQKSDIVHIGRMKPFFEFNPLTEEISQPTTNNESENEERMDTDPTPQGNHQVVEAIAHNEISQVVERAQLTSTENQHTATNVDIIEPIQGKEEEPQTQANRRSQRNRRPPARFASVYLLACVAVMAVTNALDIKMASSGVVFVKGPAVAFSESTWTLVTDLTTTPAHTIADSLTIWLSQPTTQINTTDPFMRTLQDKAAQRMKLLRRRTATVVIKLSTIDLITGYTPRTKRAIMEGGGKLLEWLFGTATDESLEAINLQVSKLEKQEKEITHLFAEQATVLNETLWETRTELNVIEKLTFQATSLNMSTLELRRKYNDLETTENARWTAWATIEQGLENADASLTWLESLVMDLQLSLEALAIGKLPPQLLGPTRLEKALDDLTRQLPRGWEVATGQREGRAWNVYRLAQVQTARYNGRLRVFAKVPLQNRGYQFYLLRVVAMPFQSNKVNKSELTIIDGLPNVLAVATDLQSYIELSEQEARECTNQLTTVCPIHVGVVKKTRTSCTFSLYQNDTTGAKELCKIKIIEAKSVAVYLGERTWALSTPNEENIITSCSHLEQSVTPSINRVTGVSIVEIPNGCTAHTEDWVLPPSLVGQTVEQEGTTQRSLNLPKLIWIGTNAPSKTAGSLNDQPDHKLTDDLAELRRRNEINARKETQVLKDVRQLEVEEQSSHSYPFEWAGTTAVLAIAAIGALLVLYRKIRRVESRLDQHMQDLQEDEVNHDTQVQDAPV
jgi:transposase InsO family protein